MDIRLIKLCLALLVFDILANWVVVAETEKIIAKKQMGGQVLAEMASFDPSLPQESFGDLLSKKLIAQANVQPTPSPTPIPRTKTLKVALLGDSMIQTMGEATYLTNILEQKLECINESYPSTSLRIKTGSCISYHVTVLNFGVGSTNLEQGLNRLPQVLNANPDVIVVESFAYNNSSMSTSRFRELLEEMINKIKNKHIKVVLLATIAPNGRLYAVGVNGWSKEERWLASHNTMRFLQETINFAIEKGIPLANAYSASLAPDGEGNTIYIDKETYLHPSKLGHQLVGQKIAEAITGVVK